MKCAAAVWGWEKSQKLLFFSAPCCCCRLLTHVVSRESSVWARIMLIQEKNHTTAFSSSLSAAGKCWCDKAKWKLNFKCHSSFSSFALCVYVSTCCWGRVQTRPRGKLPRKEEKKEVKTRWQQNENWNCCRFRLSSSDQDNGPRTRKSTSERKKREKMLCKARSGWSRCGCRGFLRINNRRWCNNEKGGERERTRAEILTRLKSATTRREVKKAHEKKNMKKWMKKLFIVFHSKWKMGEQARQAGVGELRPWTENENHFINEILLTFQLFHLLHDESLKFFKFFLFVFHRQERKKNRKFIASAASSSSFNLTTSENFCLIILLLLCSDAIQDEIS